MNEAQRLRILPLVVAFPLFLQNLDAYIMATALPTMARALQVPVLDLNLAITAYLLSLAVFLPASAWLAARFGAKRVFIAAVLFFSLGGYSQIPRESSGHATAMASMVQQLSMAVGVVVGASAVSVAGWLRGAPGAPNSGDFTVAFLLLALLALCSASAFRRFRAEDGKELRSGPRRTG